jgi:hypothetical protein
MNVGGADKNRGMTNHSDATVPALGELADTVAVVPSGRDVCGLADDSLLVHAAEVEGAERSPWGVAGSKDVYGEMCGSRQNEAPWSQSQDAQNQADHEENRKGSHRCCIQSSQN